MDTKFKNFRQIESKMNTKIKKNVFGPEDKKDRCIIFIDDFNMPMIQQYGS